MSEFIGYFDESYGTADAYSVAGYVATVQHWRGFIVENVFRTGSLYWSSFHERLLAFAHGK